LIGRFHYLSLSLEVLGSILAHTTPLSWIATARVAVCPLLSLTGPRAAAVHKLSAVFIGTASIHIIEIWF